jgi:LysM repeat protein
METNKLNQLLAQRELVVQVSNTPPSPPEPTAVPVIVSTPLPDGTVKHIIAGGQSLWALSDAYNVPFEKLLELNDLEPDVILNPGDEVIISPSYTPTSTPIGEPSSTPPPRYTHTPSLGTPQGTDQSILPATAVPTETIIAEPRFRTSVKNPLIVIAAVFISGGSLVLALYFSLRKRD